MTVQAPPSPTAYRRAAALLLHATDPATSGPGTEAVLADVTTEAEHRELVVALVDVVADMASTLLASPPAQQHLHAVVAAMVDADAREGGQR